MPTLLRLLGIVQPLVGGRRSAFILSSSFASSDLVRGVYPSERHRTTSRRTVGSIIHTPHLIAAAAPHSLSVPQHHDRAPSPVNGLRLRRRAPAAALILPRGDAERNAPQPDVITQHHCRNLLRKKSTTRTKYPAWLLQFAERMKLSRNDHRWLYLLVRREQRRKLYRIRRGQRLVFGAPTVNPDDTTKARRSVKDRRRIVSLADLQREHGDAEALAGYVASRRRSDHLFVASQRRMGWAGSPLHRLLLFALVRDRLPLSCLWDIGAYCYHRQRFTALLGRRYREYSHKVLARQCAAAMVHVLASSGQQQGADDCSFRHQAHRDGKKPKTLRPPRATVAVPASGTPNPNLPSFLSTALYDLANRAVIAPRIPHTEQPVWDVSLQPIATSRQAASGRNTTGD